MTWYKFSSSSSKCLCRGLWRAVNKGVIVTNWKKIPVCFYNGESISVVGKMLRLEEKEVLT